MIVRDKRKEKGLTQTELAQQVNVAQSMICNIENGLRVPSVTVAKRIGAVLGFNWALMFENEGQAEKEAAH